MQLDPYTTLDSLLLKMYTEFYVEMIFNAQTFVDALPQAIEAVFFMKVSRERVRCESNRPNCPHLGLEWPGIDDGQDCIDATSGPKCKDYATRAWRTLLCHFDLEPTRLPLLQFDPFDWERPFTDVSAASCGRCYC